MMVAVIMVVSFLGFRIEGVRASLVETRERKAEAVEEAGCPKRAVLALELGLVLGAAKPHVRHIRVCPQAMRGRGGHSACAGLREMTGRIKIADHGRES